MSAVKRSRERSEGALELSLRCDAGRSFTLVVNIDPAESALAADEATGKRRRSFGPSPDATVEQVDAALGGCFRSYLYDDAGSAYPSLMASPARSERGAEASFGASFR